MQIRDLAPDERSSWLRLRERLWLDARPEDLLDEQGTILSDPNRNVVLVAVSPNGELAGFVEVSLRDWAEGCHTHPVGYLEAWYVEPEHRRRGVGRALVEAAERWASALGCTEMASDADSSNDVSHRSHAALGYVEVARLVLFRKTLASDREDARARR